MRRRSISQSKVYVAKVNEATGKNLKAGYIVKADADARIAEAEKKK